MARRGGWIQRAILDLLYEAPSGYLAWEDLKRPFPFEVFDKSFYRAIRALKARGEIIDEEVCGERRIYLPFGKSREDQQLLYTTRILLNNLASLCRARGLPEEAVQRVLKGEDVDKFKRHIFSRE